MYGMLALVLVSAIGLGFYFLVNQSKQNNSNKNEVIQVSAIQPNNKSTDSENVNVASISNTNIATPTPIPTVSPTSVMNVEGAWVINFRYKDKDDWEGRTDVKFKQVGDKLIVSSKGYQPLGYPGEFIVGIWEKEPNGKIAGNKIIINMKNGVVWNGIINKNTMKGTNNQGAAWTAKRL
jgi:hypothetical protein